MFLKRLFIVLVVANLGYFAFAQGWLGDMLGTEQSEPERLKKQINAELLNVSQAPKADDSKPAQVSKLPDPSCSAAATEQWTVYIGPFATVAAKDKKKSELTALKISATEVSKPTLKYGYSLGEFQTEELAKSHLTTLRARGVKTAVVLLWSTTPC